jgi:hypothetical protein
MNLNQSARSLYATLKTTPRLRWGVLGIVGILWLYGALELRDQVKLKNDAYAAMGKKIARIQGVATESEWPARLKEAQALQLKLENRLWREATIGLAQATMNDWLTAVTQQASLGKVQLAVAAQDDDVGSGKAGSNENGSAGGQSDLWKVSARLSFDFNPQTFYPLLNRIATNDKRIAIESLVIRSTPTPKAEMSLVAYFIKPAPPASGKTQNDQH